MRTFKEKQAAKKAERIGGIILLVAVITIWVAVFYLMDGTMFM